MSDSTQVARELQALRPKTEKKCIYCGELYLGYVNNGTPYCSFKCKQAAWRRSVKARRQEKEEKQHGKPV